MDKLYSVQPNFTDTVLADKNTKTYTTSIPLITYGHPKHTEKARTLVVHALQVYAARKGVQMFRKRVARLMPAGGLRAREKRRWVLTTGSSHSFQVCPNLLDRQFDIQQLNQVWASDQTFMPTKESRLYLAVNLDLHSRTVAGYAMDAHMPAALPLAALYMTVKRRCPAPAQYPTLFRGT